MELSLWKILSPGILSQEIAQKKLGRRKKQQLHEARKKFRKVFFVFCASWVGLILAAGVVLFQTYSGGEEWVSDAKETSALIASIEANMPLFRQQLENNVGSRLPEKMREFIFQPFNCVQINQQNQYRDYNVSRQLLEKGEIYQIENRQYFRFKVMKNLPDMAALYSPPHKLMVLERSFDSKSIIDLLALYHELIHVVQDTAIRARLADKATYDRYLAFHAGALFPKGSNVTAFTVAEHEAEAYALEIEALNLLLDDKLRQDCQSGQEPSLEKYAGLLGVAPRQKAILATLLNIAKAYYGDKAYEAGMLSRDFITSVSLAYEAQGIIALPLEAMQSYIFK